MSRMSMRNGMKLLLLTFIALFSTSVSATHLVGADISYTSLGGNVYRVELTFYRDCQGSPAPLGVGIEFRSASCSQYFTDTLLQVVGTGNEITYPCPTQATSCTDPNSTLPGIQQYRYSGIVTLPARCVDWVFSWSYCCRNCDITTMYTAQPCVEGANPGMYVAANLNNFFYDDNNSPTFTNNPIAFVCLGQDFTFNHGVIDVDGDSLVYTLVNPLRSLTDSIPFIPGYSATNPITSNPPLTIDVNNGDLNMFPTQQEVGVLSVLVTEYRDGAVIGSVVRDMAIYVRPCSNELPTISGINGSLLRDTTVCPGTNLCFDIYAGDNDTAQVLSMQWNQGIPAASFNVAGSPRPVGTFCWTPTAADIRTTPHTFTVTVFDDACPNSGYQTYSFNVFVNSPAYSAQSSNISCNGLTDGSIVINPNSSSLIYSWLPGGQTGASLSGLSSGSYSVTVTDTVTGCSVQQNFTIVDPPVLTVSLTSQNPVCAGVNDGLAVAVPSGGTPNYAYVWNTLPVIQNDTATGLAPGNYAVVVTDDRGCTTTGSITIASTASPVVIAVDTSSILRCAGDQNGYASVSVSGGNPTYSYSWYALPDTITVIGTGNSISQLSAGVYFLSVNDSVGCLSTETIQIIQPAAIVVTGTSIPSTCGQPDGAASVSATGGTPGYQYLWSPGGQTSSGISNVPAGAYSVTVTDLNGCSQTAQVPVSDNNLPSPNITTIQSPTCDGASNGSVVAVPQSGTGPFTFSWNTTPVQANDTAVNLAAGTYTVGITDVNGCQSFNTVTLSGPAGIQAAVLSADALCNSESSGIGAVVSINGGTAPYAYQWSPIGGTDSIANFLPAGTYSLLISDVNGCTQLYSGIQIGEPAALSIVVDNSLQPSCYGASDGAIDLSATGGTGTLTYFWNPGGAVSQDLTNIDAGIYNVTVTDINGCTGSITVPLGQPSPININAGPDTIVCSGNAVQLDAQLGAGQTGVWSSTGSSQIVFSNFSDPTALASNLSGGQNVLTWTVTNTNGCSGAATLSVFSYGNIVATVGTDTFFCGLPTVQLNGNSVVGFPGQWSSSNGASFSNLIDPLAQAVVRNYGRDTITWTISNGACTVSDYRVLDARECGLQLPSAFSPNGDGKNDGYEIKGVWEYPDNRFRVFNRWGNEVYQKDDYVNTDWVGQGKDGDPLPDGTYFVIFEVVGDDIRLSTYVDLRR